MKRAIEDSFPIVEINRLAVPERNSFKPIYQMHKWFARRASCVFRAILLGALKPLPVDKDGKPTKSGAQVIMDEFYKDHSHDPDTNGKVVLDPFMGGGTTVVEALRLGCKVIGIDLNPVAWFIVKTEIEPVDLDELRAAFDRLAERKVEWSGKPLRETLLDLYKTKCPCCGGEADSIYTFWVKSAICTDQNCKKQVPLFGDYIVAQKTPSIRYFPDCDCPECGKVFDWDIDPAAVVGDSKLVVNAGKFSAGQGRTSARWVYGRAGKGPNREITGKVACPWCKKIVTPAKQDAKTKRKKVELAVLLCPKCESVWQFRGPLDEKLVCPCCQHEFQPRHGNIPDKGAYLCTCGNRGKIIESIRSLPEDQLLPMRAYAIEGYCPTCASSSSNVEETDDKDDLFDLAGEMPRKQKAATETGTKLDSILWKNNGKFFQRVGNADLTRYQNTLDLWEKFKARLPYPKCKIPEGDNTNQMIKHNYLYWHQMFTPRQLLALSTILEAIAGELREGEMELLLSAFQMALEANNIFARYRSNSGGRSPFGGLFARHEFAPKLTPCEINVWGPYSYYGSYLACAGKVVNGKYYAQHPYDLRSGEKIFSDVVRSTAALKCESSSSVSLRTKAAVIITDPPYAGNVNYSELADFFYVWLRLLLANRYPHFAPEITPKADEIIENKTRGKTAANFEQGLMAVFSCVRETLDDEGVMAFTFHHAEGTAWEALLQAVCRAGFQIDSVFPIHGESESSMHLLDNEAAISYDLIHVCTKRATDENINERSWARSRLDIRNRAREEIRLIESGRYGNEPLSTPDRNIILIGKCLELYSKHYGKIVDHEGKPMPLHAALEEIKMMVDQLTTAESAVPPELEDIDAPSYVYLTCLCGRKEIKSDEVHKATRGITEPSTLMERDLMIKGRAGRGRSYEVKSPLERLDLLKKKFGVNTTSPQGMLFDEDLTAVVTPGVIFVDYVHFLIGLAENGESVLEWLEKFRGKRPQIRSALDFLARRNRTFAEPVRKILGIMDERTLFNEERGTQNAE